MKPTKNFTLKEFIYSKHFGRLQARVIGTFEKNKDTLIPELQELAEQLQALRDFLNLPVNINISYRPKWWELLRLRSGKSRHTLGQAADIVSDGLTPQEIKEAIEYLIENGKMKQGGIGLYNTFVHYDIGYNGKKRRWDNSTKKK